MTADDEFDERLRPRVRDHFDRAAAAHTAPAFDAMLAAAESGGRGKDGRRRWMVVAGAVAAPLAVAVVPQLRPDADAPLIAQLTATTYWIAPSDRWPVVRTADYFGLPQFDDMNTELDEVQTWF